MRKGIISGLAAFTILCSLGTNTYKFLETKSVNQYFLACGASAEQAYEFTRISQVFRNTTETDNWFRNVMHHRPIYYLFLKSGEELAYISILENLREQYSNKSEKEIENKEKDKINFRDLI